MTRLRSTAWLMLAFCFAGPGCDETDPQPDAEALDDAGPRPMDGGRDSGGVVIMDARVDQRDARTDELKDAAPDARSMTADAHIDASPTLDAHVEVDDDAEVATDAAAPSIHGTCRDYTDEWLDISPGPDAEYTFAQRFGMTEVTYDLVWHASDPGLYAVSVEAENAEPVVSLHDGTCEGSVIPEPFRPTPGRSYTFRVGARFRRDAPTPMRARVIVERVCDDPDPKYCVIEGVAGVEPARCGLVWEMSYGGYETCEPLAAPGETDERCPDTRFFRFGPDLLEGCCTPSGVCGHMDAELGCHFLAQELWAWSNDEVLDFYCDERADPEAPDYFECGQEPCETNLDCCAHPNYGNDTCTEGVCIPAEG